MSTKNVYNTATRPYACALCKEFIYPGQQYKRSGKKKHHHQPDCEHAQSVDCHEPPSAPTGEDFASLFEKQTFRFVWTYSVRNARKMHDCYRCSNSSYVEQRMRSMIWEGDSYYAEVYSNGKRLIVRKFHDSCPFDPCELDVRDEQEDEDSHWDDATEEWELPLAA